jgi:23S rRNA (uracil1939-C5)-methyltransferase
MSIYRTIDIEDLAYGGAGVGKIEGKVYFIRGALPGERVKFIEKDNKKSFSSGILSEVLTPSPDRVSPVCPYYNKCGGCDYQHLSYEKELFFKSKQVIDTLKRIGGFSDYQYDGIMPSPNEYGYRSSITLHRSEHAYGFFSKQGRDLIAIDSCPLAVDSINMHIPKLFEISGKKDVTIKSDRQGKVYISNQPGSRFYKDSFFGTDIMFSPLAFSQVNAPIASSIAEKLGQWVKQEAAGNVLFDVFCGVGFFSALLRDLFDSVIGIDNSSIAIDCAAATKKSLKAENIKFYCDDAEKKFPAYYLKFSKTQNVILLDPPRSGIDKPLAEYLSRIENAHSIYYISCDPATLARDSMLITKSKKWALERVACFAMFPRTKHIESMALFKRQEKQPL